MNKKIISTVLAAATLLTVSTSNISTITAAAEKNNTKTESKAEESDSCIVHFVLFVSDDFKDAQKDVKLTFRGNGEELTGVLDFSNDYNLNIALKKCVSYELTFGGELGGYEILGAEKYVYFEEDATVNLTMKGATEQAQPQESVTEISDGELTEEQRIVKNYVAKLQEFVDSSAENAKVLEMIPSATLARNYLKESGDCYDSETWKTLTEFEQRLYWILYQNPDMMFRDNFDLMEKEDIVNSRYISGTYALGGKYQEFVEMTIDDLWAFQLEQTKIMGGVVPDYFKVYMDLKNGVANEPVEEDPVIDESQAETVTSIVTTTAAQTEPVTTTKKPENKEAKKAVKSFGERMVDALKSNRITIGILVFALIGLCVSRIIRKKIKNSAYNSDDE